MSAFETRLTVLCAAMLLIASASVAALAQQPPLGRVAGVVVDSSNGVLPGVLVSAVGADGRTLSTTVTAGAGDFLFERLPAGPIDLLFHLDGFEDVKTAAVVEAPALGTTKAVATITQKLELKGLSETVVVRGDPPPPPPKPRPVLQAVKEHDPSAVCGPAKAEGVMRSLGTVLGSPDASRGLFGRSDEVQIDGGLRAGIKVGDNFIVRRRYQTTIVEKDRRPMMGEHSSGLIQIVAANDDSSTALVVYACDEMMSGDYLVRFEAEPPNTPEPIGTPSFDAAARILFADVGKGLGITNRMLVIDRGSVDGVQAGQRFTLFRRSRLSRSRPIVVGEAVVVAARRDSATIRVEHSTDVVFPGMNGDWAAPHKPLQRASQ